jgi:hypothetical protein
MNQSNDAFKQVDVQFEAFSKDLIIKEVDFNLFTDFMNQVGSGMIDTDNLHFSDLKFISGLKVVMTIDTPIDDIISKKIPVMDFFLAKSIIRTTDMKSITFTVNKELTKTEFSGLIIARAASLFFMVFLLRGKVYFENKDTLPNFCKKVFHIENIQDYRKFVTNNNLSKLDYKWILNLDWQCFCEPIKVRLLLGIAGYRAMKVFKRYPCIENIDSNLKMVFEIVKKKATEGVMLEYHPFFNHNKGLNLAKNLNQLMLQSISTENLELAKLNGLIFDIPQLDINFSFFLAWDCNNLNYFETNI